MKKYIFNFPEVAIKLFDKKVYIHQLTLLSDNSFFYNHRQHQRFIKQAGRNILTKSYEHVYLLRSASLIQVMYYKTIPNKQFEIRLEKKVLTHLYI